MQKNDSTHFSEISPDPAGIRCCPPPVKDKAGIDAKLRVFAVKYGAEIPG